MSDIDQLIIECMKRVDANEEIEREAFLASHPDCADELRDYFESVDEIERLAGPLVSSTVDNGAPPAETHGTGVGDSILESPPEKSRSAGSESLPEVIGRYRIEKQLGRGAMGAVYLAHDSQLDRRVALKTPTFDATADADMIERFYREARAAANLRHAGICPIFDVGKINETHYISMAYIEGKPMSALVDVDKPLPIRSVVSLVRRIALALDHAHNQGVIHRDLKPANIMIDKQKQPLIMDFGLARRVDKHEQTRLTQDGMILGTPAYMSPEQVQGDLDSGKQSDVYSLGVILYELLTGDLPFQGTIAAVIGQIMTQDAPAPSSERAEIDTALDAICQKMMARKIENRYAGMKEVSEALTNLLKRRNQSDTATATATGTLDGAEQEALSALFTAQSADATAPTITHKPKKPVKRSPIAGKSLIERLREVRPLAEWSAAAMAATLLAVWGIVLLVRSDEGTLRIEILDPDVVVTIDDDEVEFTSGKKTLEVGPHQLSIKVGDATVNLAEKTRLTTDGRRVVIKLGDAEVKSETFTVLKGEDRVLRISVVKVPSDSSTPLSEMSREGLLSRWLREQGTPAAGETARAMSKLRWPYDAFSRDSIDPHELRAAGGGDASNAPEELVAVVGDSRLKHWLDVQFVSFSPDGKLLASAGGDRTIVLWDVKTGRAVRTLHGHTREVRCVEFSPDGKLLASCGPVGLNVNSNEKYTITIWDAASGDIKLAFKGGHSDQVRRVAFSPDGKTLASASYDNNLILWDINTGAVRHTVEHPHDVLDVTFSNDGDLLATGCRDKLIRLYHAATGELVGEPLRGHTNLIQDLDFNRDGTLLASAGRDTTVGIWDVASQRRLHTLESHKERVQAVCFSPNGKSLASGDGDGSIRFWDVRTGKELAKPKLEGITPYRYDRNIECLRYNNDGTMLASGSTDRSIRIWNLSTGKQVHQLVGHKSGIRRAAMSRNGEILSSSSLDGTNLTWDLTTGKLLKRIEQSGVRQRSVDVSDDGSVTVTSTQSHTSSGRTWNPRTGKMLRRVRGSWPDIVRLTPDGKRLVTYDVYGQEDKSRRLLVHDLATNGRLTTIPVPGPKISHMELAADGKVLAAAIGSILRFYDLETGKPVGRDLAAHSQDVGGIAFSSDGRWMATSSWYSRDLKLWNITGVSPVLQRTLIKGSLAENSVRQSQMAFTPDSQRLATSEETGTIRIWDAQTGRMTHTFQATPVLINPHRIFFTPDGRHLVTANTNGTFFVFRLGPESETPRMPLRDGPPGEVLVFDKHTDRVLDVDVSPDGRLALSCSYDGTVRLWEIATGKELQLLRHHDEGTARGIHGRYVRFSPSGKFAISSSREEDDIYVWNLRNGALVKKLKQTAKGTYPTAFLNDDFTFITALWRQGEIRIWDIRAEKVVRNFTTPVNRRVWFSTNGRFMLQYEKTNVKSSMELWDCTTGLLKQTYTGHQAVLRAGAFSSDGKFVLTGDENASVHYWNASTGNLIHELKGHHTDIIASLAFSPDDRYALSSSQAHFDSGGNWRAPREKMIRLWDLATGQQVHEFPGHKSHIHKVLFTPNGRFALSASSDKTVRVWRLPENVRPEIELKPTVEDR